MIDRNRVFSAAETPMDSEAAFVVWAIEQMTRDGKRRMFLATEDGAIADLWQDGRLEFVAANSRVARRQRMPRGRHRDLMALPWTFAQIRVAAEEVAA